jgi:YVTN family beta-propeller protein
VAVNPDTNKIYVTLHGKSQLAVIDGATDTVAKTIPNLPGAFDVIVNRPDNQVYVSARDAHFVSVINGATDEEGARIMPGGETYAMAFDSALKQLYVLIDPDGPLYLLDDPIGDIYLPLPDLNKQETPNPNVVVIFEVKPNYDFGRRGYRVAGEAGPQGGIGIAANPTTGNFFVTNAAANTLTVFDGVSLVTHATLPMDGDPGDVAVNPANNRVYVSNRAADVVHMIIDGW